jgi:hypothetical protein
VLKAIVQVLADRGEPMHVKDIHAAVEALVGEPVPPSSVKGGLAKHVAGSLARFVRLARGRYILAYPCRSWGAVLSRIVRACWQAHAHGWNRLLAARRPSAVFATPQVQFAAQVDSGRADA